jgi:cytochrome b561
LLLHRSVGLTVLAAMLFRIGWLRLHPAPPLPPTVTGVARILARGTHWVLYLLLVVMPLAGYVNAAAAGHAVSFFGIVSIPPLIPRTTGSRNCASPSNSSVNISCISLWHSTSQAIYGTA